MSTRRPSLRRAGSGAVLAAVLLTGCGDEGATDEGANGDDVSETGGSDDGTSGDDMSDAEDPDAAADGEDSEEPSGGEDGDSDDDVETFEVTIAGGEVSPPFDTYDVELGADVRIEITSDVADELHLHGYDRELALEPGEPGELEFTADIEGRFELETHELGLQLLQLEVG